MKPTRDELVERRGPVKRPPARKNDGGSGWGMKIVVVLLFSLALGAAGYLWVKVQELNAVLDQSLKASQEQLGTLESKVKTQDKSLEMTGDKVTSSINHLNSEVRKLWDLSNKKNRGDIETLQKTVQTLQTRLDADAKARADLVTQLTQAKEEVKSLKAQVQEAGKLADKFKPLQESVAALKAEQGELLITSNRIAEEQVTLQAKVSKQATQIAAASKAPAVPADVGRRLTEVEADIRSINAHRQQVNSRLNQLDQDIQGLYQRR